MNKNHISVRRAWLIWGIGLALSIVGVVNVAWQMAVPSYYFNFQYLLLGGMLLIIGFGLIVVNWAIFNARKTQLDIDTQEALRDKIGNVCPNCGNRLPQNSRFCNNCGAHLS